MSGRSAHVRKKINDPRTADKPTGLGRGRANSSGSGRASSREEYGAPSPETGYGTTNARLLRFPEPIRESDFSHYRPDTIRFSNPSNGSQSGGSESGKGDVHIPRYQGPMPDFAYARVRKPVLKTEDVSGIERSGFRSAVDKKSEEVRRGITKAFSFGSKKKKKDSEPDARSPSSVGARQFDDYNMSHDVERPPPPHALITHLSPTIMDMEHYYMTSPPPSTKLPAIPQPSGPPIQRWIGAGRPVQRWNKLRKDPELWDPNGDVLVYFGHKGQTPRPNPSFRLSSHIIEATESRFLITLLREGSTDDEDIHMQMPPSPIDASPIGPRRGSNHHLGPGYGQVGQPTPPISDDASLAEADGQISYEMYFPTPPNMTGVDAHRHAVTTRNVFALLYHASLVGFSLYQALSDLLGRLEAYMPQDADNVGTILNYLSARAMDDPRNNPETAVSILAWSETPDVRWEEGWRESFVHCAGMYPRLESCADYKCLTPITRALLERAFLETQLRVQAAKGRLAEFAYSDMWPSSGPVASSPSRAAADRLQKFFVAHYAAIYGSWPPPPQQPQHQAAGAEGEELWLTRIMVQKLASDFGALYDYLVNRSIVWDESEFRSSRKWMLVSETGDKSFNADTPDLPLTDLLIEFDNRQRFPHIPHPYPLVPESIPPPSNPSRSAAGGRDKGKRVDKTAAANGNGAAGNADRTLERRVQLAYTEATNIYMLGSELAHSELIDAFVKFEKTDHQRQVGGAGGPSHLDPFAARRGRWVLVYGILQTLASISVDAPFIRYRGPDVAYHLSPRLRSTTNLNAKIPPWKGASAPAPPDASHELSHCWTAPATWRRAGETSDEEEGDRAAATAISRGISHLEDDSDGGGGGGEAVLRMMRSQVQRFPSPPQSQFHTSSSAHFRMQQQQQMVTGMNRSGSQQASSPPPLPPWNNPNSAQSPTHGGRVPGLWPARNFKQQQQPVSSAISISARSDDTASVTGFSSHRASRITTAGSVSGDTKPRSVRSYATFGNGRSGAVPAPLSPSLYPPHSPLYPLSIPFSAHTTTTAGTSRSSVAADDSSTVVDEAEWPVRTHSVVRDIDFSVASSPSSPPPNKPLPLPLPLQQLAMRSSNSTATAGAAASSSLTSMIAVTNHRGVVANVDVATDHDHDHIGNDDSNNAEDGEGDANNSSSSSPPPPVPSPRNRRDITPVVDRNLAGPHLHRRESSGALGHVINRGFEGFNVSSDNGDDSDDERANDDRQDSDR
ncbi:hypothetical protein SLS62_005040 [Diatrype stigma]|uniref:DUF8004 domain-containing protein n=1 Tax=Diatrype stigma TaxID=117547 RepID=A0AAN9UQE7_9PEZI